MTTTNPPLLDALVTIWPNVITGDPHEWQRTCDVPDAIAEASLDDLKDRTTKPTKVDVRDAIRKAKGRAAIANIRALYPHLNRDTAGASK